MMTSTITKSLKELKMALPINLASRTLAYKNANNLTEENDDSCTAYLLAANVTDPTTLCTTYNFTNMTDV